MTDTLKHPWSEEQKEILRALKRKLLQRPFAVERDNYVVFQRTLQRVMARFGEQKEFYHLWDEIPCDFASRLSCWDLRALYLTQAAVGVFTGQNPLLRENRELCEYWENNLFSFAYPRSLQTLPERLPDKNLQEAVRAGDIARIIFLYDSAATPGQKLKNICNILFNNRKYGMLVHLNKIYSCLNFTDKEILSSHLFRSYNSKGKILFDRWCFSNMKELKNSWSKMMRSGALLDGIITALESGWDPDANAFPASQVKVSLRQFLYFIDEISKEAKNFPYKDFPQLLNAAKKFCLYENEEKKN